jgi:hypothetical protein
MSTAKLIKVLAGAWLAALLWAPPSAASQGYPEIVADTLAMPCTPTCLLCHDSLQGGINTLNDFGTVAKANGILPLNTPTIAPALMTMETAMPPADTDGDLTADIAELRVGADPNVAGVGEVCGGGPTYGCGARIARGRSFDLSAIAAGLSTILALLFAGRRRR